MNKFREVNIIIFFILSILIYDACQEQAIVSYPPIIIELTQSGRVESWSFRFVKVDTSINDLVTVNKGFNIEFTQQDTLVIPDSTELFFVAGIDTIEEVIFPDSSFYLNDTTVVIVYQNPDLTSGTWYVTASTKFKDHSIRSFWSKPVYFKFDVITGI